MENITYVTGNYGKYCSVKERLNKNGIDINYYKVDLEEPDVNDIEYISKVKAMEAYEIIKNPVFVADSGFYIEDYPQEPGYPGAFVKRSGISTNIEELLNIMKDIKNRSCYFLDCLTYYDGTNIKQFFGISKGELSTTIRGDSIQKAWSNLWYVFIPLNCNKTLAEMNDYERDNRPDERTSAIDEFITWYKDNFINCMKKELTNI